MKIIHSIKKIVSLLFKPFKRKKASSKEKKDEEKKDNKNERVGKIKDFLLLIGGYGFLINTMLWSIFGRKFNIFTLVGYGILYYLIKDEFPEWFRRLFPERRIR